ncbi:DNA-binding protein [Acinetobacter radioresistens]|uniref:DNA-binding protein n=1 Tax=Acinetobacter radioresistens TaxID=40216 RepID=UPI002A27D34A|nr:DNA-binding protein [Acinetobacter radioresistens]EJB8578547.1 DNA-binding protein [Acinetobacter baumannii]MDY0842523.1 DNA-binding protein [Acinetobacter radioresistens]
MSRSGLTKNKVKQARDILISQNKYPSVDAVRIELGNTGSKSTIHKYLKELEEDEEQGIGQNLSVSETIQSLVIRLAEQLHLEANIEIEKVKEAYRINEEKLKEEIGSLRNELNQTEILLQRSNESLAKQDEINKVLKNSLEQETFVKNRLEQQVVNLNESLEQNKGYLTNLEDKYKHAQQSLEHYRESVKEQRQQDLRRHDHQVQLLQAEIRQLQQTIVIKQDKLNELSLENTKLATELSISNENNKKCEKSLDDLGKQLEQVKQHETSLLSGLKSHQETIQKLEIRLNKVTQEKNTLDQHAKELHEDLIESKIKFETQQSVFTQLQSMLAMQKNIKPYD